MEVLAGNYEVLEFLKAWGIDTEKMISVTIHIPKDDIVTATVTSLKAVDAKALKETMIKEYALVELKNE